MGILGTTATAGTTATLPIYWTYLSSVLETQLMMFEPDVATPHTFTVKIRDTCTGPAENFTVNSIKIDVLQSP